MKCCPTLVVDAQGGFIDFDDRVAGVAQPDLDVLADDLCATAASARAAGIWSALRRLNI